MRYSASKNGATLKLKAGVVQALKMAPFDKSYTTFYWSAIVPIAVFCTIFKLFDVDKYCEIEIWLLEVTQGH